MRKYIIGAAAGYVLGSKAGRKRYHQIVNTAQAIGNSPLTKRVTRGARKALAEKIDPEPRMKELKERGRKRSTQIFEPDVD